MPEFACSGTSSAATLSHAWEHCVGSGHAPLALRADWRDQLARARRELGFGHVRFHALLSDQMGTLVCENDQLLFSFFNADSIVDFLLSIGMRPFVELSFMPEALASASKTVFRYQANVTPPKDLRQWALLVRTLAGHWTERYGIEEVSQWFFEVWNEPNLDAFWTTRRAEYFALYRETVRAMKAVDRRLRVGGPATAQNAWLKEFLAYCRTHRLPADFISTHYYPTDAFGKIDADTLTQLEHAPRGVMADRAAEARRQAGAKPVYYTEWNISSNPRDPLHDQPFAAAFAIEIAMGVQAFVQGFSFWTFTDIFEENYFPSMPFHGGFGLLSLHGIAKPVYRAFELLHRLGTELLPVTGTHATVSVWVTRRDARTSHVLLTNHAMPRHDIATEHVTIALPHWPRPQAAFIERVDDSHANPEARWREMGSPEYPTANQIRELHLASSLVAEPQPVKQDGTTLQLQTILPPESIALITLEFPEEAPSAGAPSRSPRVA